MRCMGLVTDDGLAKEAAPYGSAGGKPQVVWPNGTLASVAVGFFVKLVTPWETLKADVLTFRVRWRFAVSSAQQQARLSAREL